MAGPPLLEKRRGEFEGVIKKLPPAPQSPWVVLSFLRSLKRL
jgi:hypothetical protein